MAGDGVGQWMRLYGSGQCPGQSNPLNFSGILLGMHPLRLRTFDIPRGDISLTWGLILLVSLRVMASSPGASYSGIPQGELFTWGLTSFLSDSLLLAQCMSQTFVSPSVPNCTEHPKTLCHCLVSSICRVKKGKLHVR